MRIKHKTYLCLRVLLLAQLFILGQFAFGSQRRISVGSEVPEFSAVDVAGKTYSYKHGGGKALMAVFELGRVYQAKEEYDKAADAYYHALKLVYGDK